MGLRDRIRQLTSVVIPRGSLTSQSIWSGVWVAMLNVGDRLLQLGMVVILARLLAPADFGLMGIALLMLSGLTRFSQLGLNQALVYNREADIDGYLNTTWSLNIGRGLGIAAVLVVGAPLAASVFGEPRAEPVIQVLAVSPLLFGLRNPGVVYFQKDLEFQKEFVYELSGAIVQFVVAVAYALAFANVWALVFGNIAKNATRFLVSYVVHSYRPRPGFDRAIAAELVNYGKWITGSSITNYLKSEGDDAVVGWLLGAASLGFYQMAYRLSNAPATEITHTISRVAFPAYSKLQDDLDALRTGYFRVLKLTLLLALPAGIGLAAVAPLFVEAVLGPNWLPIVLTLQVLTVYGMQRAFGATFGPVWRAIGRPDYQTKLSLVSVVLMAIAIIPLSVSYGFLGTALVIVGVELAVVRPISAVITMREIDASIGRLLKEVAYPLTASLGMGATVVVARRQVAVLSPMVELGLLIVLGIVVYGLLVALLEVRFGWGLRREFRRVRQAM